jgi:tRNA 2-selenouridine synthase SelU
MTETDSRKTAVSYIRFKNRSMCSRGGLKCHDAHSKVCKNLSTVSNMKKGEWGKHTLTTSAIGNFVSL